MDHRQTPDREFLLTGRRVGLAPGGIRALEGAVAPLRPVAIRPGTYCARGLERPRRGQMSQFFARKASSGRGGVAAVRGTRAQRACFAAALRRVDRLLTTARFLGFRPSKRRPRSGRPEANRSRPTRLVGLGRSPARSPLKNCFGCDVGGRESRLVCGNAGESVDSARLSCAGQGFRTPAARRMSSSTGS